MKNLGKMFLLLVLIPNAMYASVVASVDYSSVVVGETVTYSLEISGKNLQRPMLSSICDSNIIATSSQTNIEMINGKYNKTKILSYKFMPRKSCEIKPFDVIVDGKKQTTNAVKVEVKPATQDVNADFMLELSTDKKDVYVGQPFTMIMLIKQKHTAQALDSKFIAPVMKGFWKSGEPKQEKYDDGAFTITKLTYKLSAQREGELKIVPAQLAIASRKQTRDMWGSFMRDVKWKSYYSNEIKINAKPIPQGAKFIGDFSIKARVDKKEINPNEAVNVTIEVIGEGNLEDITKFKPHIKDVSVFDEKPVVFANKFQEKLALVGDNNFIVPAFSLTFFNPKTDKLETISTEKIAIKVNGAKPKEALKIKRDKTVKSVVKVQTVTAKSLSIVEVIFIFILGLVVGIIIMLVKPWSAFRREKSLDIKDEKKLLIKLMPYSEDKEVQQIMDILEHNIYAKDKKVVDKKLLKEIIKKYDIH
ncbi:MAG: BatD family protein [Sulfurimonas sp.]